MKVYRDYTKAQNEPYLDNCYYESSKRDQNDIEVTDDIEAWKAFFLVNQMDYKKCRSFIKGYFDSLGGFDNLNNDQKDIACEWFLCTPDQMMDFFQNTQGLTAQEAINKKINNSGEFNRCSYMARSNRFNATFVYVRNVLKREDLDIICPKIIEWELEVYYEKYGIEGTMKVNYEGVNDLIGLFDFMLGTIEWQLIPRPTFESLMTVPQYGLSKQNVIDQCMEILDNGIY